MRAVKPCTLHLPSVIMEHDGVSPRQARKGWSAKHREGKVERGSTKYNIMGGAWVASSCDNDIKSGTWEIRFLSARSVA